MCEDRWGEERRADGAVEGWSGGGMERWRDGGMERWRDGAVEGWSGGAVDHRLLDGRTDDRPSLQTTPPSVCQSNILKELNLPQAVGELLQPPLLLLLLSMSFVNKRRRRENNTPKTSKDNLQKLNCKPSGVGRHTVTCSQKEEEERQEERERERERERWEATCERC